MAGATTAIEPRPQPESQAAGLGVQSVVGSRAVALRFIAERDSKARLTVYNTRGRLVRTLLDGQVGAGDHQLLWDGQSEQGSGEPSGVYFARLRLGERQLAVVKFVWLD